MHVTKSEQSHQLSVSCNGCFWHGHAGCGKAILPKTNAEFWKRKIELNKERDARNIKEVERTGWRCVVIWQCELKRDVREKTLSSLVQKIYNNPGELCEL